MQWYPIFTFIILILIYISLTTMLATEVALGVNGASSEVSLLSDELNISHLYTSLGGV